MKLLRPWQEVSGLLASCRRPDGAGRGLSLRL